MLKVEENYYKKIKNILIESLGIDEKKISINSSLVEDLCLDSLDMIELVMAIEDDFEIDIHEDKITDIKTVPDIINFLIKLNL